jgi:glycosyltransferase involved in cell wall biosynthesis
MSRVSGRVLHVLQPEDGGVRQHVLHVAGALAARGWEVEVAASENAGLAAALEADGVPVHTIPMARRPGPNDVSAARALRRLDSGRRYDLVHAHSSKAGALTRGALPRRRRLIYTPHCPAFVAAFGPARALYWAVEQALVPRSGVIVACSEWERRILTKQLAGARVVLIRNGVPPCRDVEPEPRLDMLPKPLVGFLARLDPQKDPLALVEAIDLLPERPPGSVAIVGNGRLEEEVREAIGDRRAPIVLLPFEPPVERYLSAFDLYVLPSRWESLPLAVLEAMACGVPVLATDVGGTGEAVENGVTGRLVRSRDAQALADAIQELTRDRFALEAMGTAARRAAATTFSLDRQVDELEALYRERLSSTVA